MTTKPDEGLKQGPERADSEQREFGEFGELPPASLTSDAGADLTSRTAVENDDASNADGPHDPLVDDRPEIILETGERPRALDAALSVIRKRGELLERGGEAVRLAGDIIVPVTAHWLSDYLGRHARFVTIKLVNGMEEKTPADTPILLCHQFIAKRGERGLKDLKGIITAPTLRADGSLLCTPGYDEPSGLLLRGGGWPSIPDSPTDAELATAFEVLWTPFKDFPYVAKEDIAVVLACLLTAIIRPTLPCAPAFSFDAPAAATGKTLLGQCILRLCGASPDATPECRDGEEMRKRLLAILREGKPAILFDNIRGEFGSAALEAFLTTEFYSDRVLGVSQTLSLPTNFLFLISGNNFCAKGDLYRRILTAHLDAQTDAPERRYFELRPLDYCHAHRQDLVAAGLTLLRGFVVAGQPRMTRDPLGSFEQWDDRVRQAVLWIAQFGFIELGDPIASIEVAKEQEPDRQKLARFLETVATVLEDDQRWCVTDLVQLADNQCATLPGSGEKISPLLYDVLEEIAGQGGKINRHKLGRWIQSHANMRCAGYYLERDGTKQHRAVWRIRRYNRGNDHHGV